MKQPDWNPHQKGKKEAGKSWSPDEWREFSEATQLFSAGRKKKNKGVKRKQWWADRQAKRRAWHSSGSGDVVSAQEEPPPADEPQGQDGAQEVQPPLEVPAPEEVPAPGVVPAPWEVPLDVGPPIHGLQPLLRPHGSIQSRLMGSPSFPPQPPDLIFTSESRRSLPALPKAMPRPLNPSALPRPLSPWGDTPGLLISFPRGPVFVPGDMADHLLHGLAAAQAHSFLSRIYGGPLTSWNVQNVSRPPHIIIDEEDEEDWPLQGNSSSSSSRQRRW